MLKVFTYKIGCKPFHRAINLKKQVSIEVGFVGHQLSVICVKPTEVHALSVSITLLRGEERLI